jgi:hypothetical protein
MRPYRKPARTSSATTELIQKFDALIHLLEDKNVIEAGELDDVLMNIKVQMGGVQGGQEPRGHAPRQPVTQRTADAEGVYVGLERRHELESNASPERRLPARAPIAHLSGNVMVADGSESVSGVQLILRRTTPGDRPTQFRSTKTDQNGRYIFLNLPLASAKLPDIVYSYHLEARYRNQTIHVSTALAFVADETLSYSVHLPGEPNEEL